MEMKKYFIYNRKSTDEKDKQELSLDSQSRENHNLADRLSLTVYKEVFESMSARKKGRPIFNAMLEEIKLGKADGVIAWKLDRITRNLFDIATVADLIDQGVDFKFCSGSHDNSPSGKANLAVQAAFAKLFVDQLSEDTKRGLREKFLRGGFPSCAPTGYINRDKEIYIDQRTSPMVIRAFNLYANYDDLSLKDVARVLIKEGFTSRYGGLISKSSLEKIYKNPFYYGYMRFNDEIAAGVHQPLITKELWDKVQNKLTNKNNPRPYKYHYIFRDFLVCGECGRKITAEQHKGHTYYRCTKSGGTDACSQPYVREEDLDPQIAEGIKVIAIDDKVMAYVKDALKLSHAEEINFRDSALNRLSLQFNQIQAKKDDLLDAMIDNTIDKETYKEKSVLLDSQKQNINQQITNYKNANENWFDAAEKFLELAHDSYKLYKIANPEQKRRLVSDISSNSPIYNKKVLFNHKQPFNILAKGTLFTKNEQWLPDRDSNPNLQDQNLPSYP